MKLYVIASYSGRTDEEVEAVRQKILERVQGVVEEEVELLHPTPGMKRVASEVDAVMKADIVLLAKGFQYSMPSRVVHFAASNYVDGMYEEDWLDAMEKSKREDEERKRKEDEQAVDRDLLEEMYARMDAGEDITDEDIMAAMAERRQAEGEEQDEDTSE